MNEEAEEYPVCRAKVFKCTNVLRWADKGGLRPVLQQLWETTDKSQGEWHDVPTEIVKKHNPNKV